MRLGFGIGWEGWEGPETGVRRWKEGGLDENGWGGRGRLECGAEEERGPAAENGGESLGCASYREAWPG